MQDPLVALLLLAGGLGCIVGWGVCRVLMESRAYRVQREADAIKDHVVRGGRLPDGAPSALARSYLRLRWLDILANALLGAGIAAGIAGVALTQLSIF